MSKATPTRFLSPVGRIVYGHPSKRVPKLDQQTRKPLLNDDGTPKMNVYFGLAIPKAVFNTEVWPFMAAEIVQGYPSGVPSNFSYKYKDGDSNDRQGKPYSARTGYAGCMVLQISSDLPIPPQVWKRQPNGSFTQMAENEIKTGDWVRVNLSLVVNVPENRTHTPGLYVNPDIIEFAGYGDAIYNGPDAATVFATPIAALPPGASATPTGGAQPGMQPGPTAPAVAPLAAPLAAAPPALAPAIASLSSPPGLPAMPGAPVALQPPVAVAPLAPAHDFVANAAGAPAGRVPVAYDGKTGQPIYGYSQVDGSPIYQ